MSSVYHSIFIEFCFLAAYSPLALRGNGDGKLSEFGCHPCGLRDTVPAAIRNPSCDVRERPLTLTLSPQGRGEGKKRRRIDSRMDFGRAFNS